MRALGFEVKKVDVLKILKDYDREGNGKITFEDFNEVGKVVLTLNLMVYNWNKQRASGGRRGAIVYRMP